MMVFINAVYKESNFPKVYAEGFIKLLNPIAPFMTEEIWNKIGHNETIAYEPWPEYDEAKTIEETVEIGVQVNGKLRGSIEVNNDTSEDDMIKLALANENVIRHTDDKEIIKTIVIKKRIVNIVVK